MAEGAGATPPGPQGSLALSLVRYLNDEDFIVVLLVHCRSAERVGDPTPYARHNHDNLIFLDPIPFPYRFLVVARVSALPFSGLSRIPWYSVLSGSTFW